MGEGKEKCNGKIFTCETACKPLQRISPLKDLASTQFVDIDMPIGV